MKHNPISLGFAAFTALSLTVACNVDPNRIDTDVDNTILKKKCAAANALNLDVINNNRVVRMDGAVDTTMTVNFKAQSGNLVVVEDSKTSAENVDANAIQMDISNCQVDKTATVKIPSSLEADEEKREIVATVTDVDTHKIELANDDASYVLEVTGADALMSVIASDNMAEDGVNQVKLTKKDKNGVVTVYISDSIEAGSNIVALDESVVALINGVESSSTLATVRDQYKTMSGGKLDTLTGPTRLTLDKWRAVRDETVVSEDMITIDPVSNDDGSIVPAVPVIDDRARAEQEAREEAAAGEEEASEEDDEASDETEDTE